jgi:hypothetical protein
MAASGRLATDAAPGLGELDDRSLNPLFINPAYKYRPG